MAPDKEIKKIHTELEEKYGKTKRKLLKPLSFYFPILGENDVTGKVELFPDKREFILEINHLGRTAKTGFGSIDWSKRVCFEVMIPGMMFEREDITLWSYPVLISEIENYFGEKI